MEAKRYENSLHDDVDALADDANVAVEAAASKAHVRVERAAEKSCT